MTCHSPHIYSRPLYLNMLHMKHTDLPINLSDTYFVLPVKLIPANNGDLVIVLPKTGPSAGTKFMTPGGRPASRRILKTMYDERTAVSDGFHNTTFPYNQETIL